MIMVNEFIKTIFYLYIIGIMGQSYLFFEDNVNKMKILNTKFKGLKIIKGVNHYDNRGYFRETFKNGFFKKRSFVFWSW